jgi:1-acyl-sn-glycerol-3-phosphate acyltransferase
VAPDRVTSQRLRDLLPSPFSLPAPSPPPRRPRRRARDPFGYSPRLHDQVRPLAKFFYRRYWRVETSGVANIPGSGAALVVGNHSGAIPLDAAMLVTAVDLDHPQHRLLRFLYDRFVADMPLVGDFYSRMGSVVASYENARALLRRGDLVGIFPEGVDGVAKGLGRRYQVQRFRTGFVRLSLEQRVPVVPVAIVGAEETYPLIGKWSAGGLFTRLLNVPYLPVTPFFPLFGVLGAIPLPTRWRVRFAEPLHLYAETGIDAGSRRCVEELTERVRRQIQGMVHQLLAERDSVF